MGETITLNQNGEVKNEKWYEVHLPGLMMVGKVKSEDDEKIEFESLYNIMVLPNQQTGTTQIIPVRVQPIFKYSKDITLPYVYKSQCYAYYEMSEVDVKKLKDLIIEIEAAASGLTIPGSTKTGKTKPPTKIIGN